MQNFPISEVWPGKPLPLGSTWDGDGVNFALFSAHAEKVELCLFDADGERELQRVELKERTGDIWHCYLPQAHAGLLYGYRVHGPYKPNDGHRFNPHKLLIDPYAKSIAGELRWSDAHFGYRIGDKREDLSCDRRDSASGMPKCRVIDAAYDWEDDRPPRIPWADTVIYELHVKGFTARHPAVPPELRGTYAGLADAHAIAHFKRLGITTVELLPVHMFADDRYLLQKGLRNYWGYNAYAFFVPDPRYSASGEISEFKTMVKALHAAGIEVILDVVYNHTAEGNHLGPTLSLRGIDNASYYRLMPGNARYHMDFTGCGNTLNTANPRVHDLVLDSLRYWVEEMHVDGFRFDLAVALTRGADAVEMSGAFLENISRDPVLSQVKLIAEPWDLGLGGYQLGGFPSGWAEWNDRCRDALRAFVKADAGSRGEFAMRFTGSSDLFQHSGRKPQASINFITAHDGFTLHDLVSFNQKRNDANLEGNRDGNDHNLSWNCGAEGRTDSDDVNTLRRRQKRNLLAMLFLSQGVPMLLAGDELGHTQGGNNNAYCQDNEISWLDWNLRPEDRQLMEFVRRLNALRREAPVLCRETFLEGRPVRAKGVKDVTWLRPDGHEMDQDEWRKAQAHCLGICLAAAAPKELTPLRRGRVARVWEWLASRLRGWVRRLRHAPADGSLLVLVNTHHETIRFAIPDLGERFVWSPILDTHDEEDSQSNARLQAGDHYHLRGRSIAVLRLV